MKKVYSGKMPLNEWLEFFTEFIFPVDMNEDVGEPFLRYLADLGVLVSHDVDNWEWNDCDSHVDSVILLDIIKKNLESLCDSDSGFALPYFIGYKSICKKPLGPKEEPFVKDKRDVTPKHSELSHSTNPASDLSNLQIVKKVGKQLQPFLQIEESIISRLVGEHVSKQDAQKLFHYIFGKMNTKAEPRVWEQLSRKRHR
jgi:hypothetical protein